MTVGGHPAIEGALGRDVVADHEHLAGSVSCARVATVLRPQSGPVAVVSTVAEAALGIHVHPCGVRVGRPVERYNVSHGSDGRMGVRAGCPIDSPLLVDESDQLRLFRRDGWIEDVGRYRRDRDGGRATGRLEGEADDRPGARAPLRNLDPAVDVPRDRRPRRGVQRRLPLPVGDGSHAVREYLDLRLAAAAIVDDPHDLGEGGRAREDPDDDDQTRDDAPGLGEKPLHRGGNSSERHPAARCPDPRESGCAPGQRALGR